jgi:hypothetical protein
MPGWLSRSTHVRRPVTGLEGGLAPALLDASSLSKRSSGGMPTFQTCHRASRTNRRGDIYYYAVREV